VPEDRWPALVEAATFENMREHADVIAPDTTNAIWTDNKRFFNRGRSGQWHDLLDDAALERYEKRVATLATPDVVRWAHAGGRV
jgi:aryl sulfotransferase